MTFSTDFNEKSNAQEKRDNLLIAAIHSRDLEKIERALKEGADPNARDGLPLRTAAENDDYLSAKHLIKHNADIGYALMRTQVEHDAIPRERHGSGLFSFYEPKTAEGRALETKLNRQLGKLKSFQECYISSSLPQEQMQLMHEMNARLIQLEKQIKDLTEPRKIEKSGKLPAPQSLNPQGKM